MLTEIQKFCYRGNVTSSVSSRLWLMCSTVVVFLSGVFRCGPASVNAIKNGEVYLPYDTGFIFAEVNGDRVYWDVDDDDGSMKAYYIDKYSIGKCISTKMPGSTARLEVTRGYKHPEGKLNYL